jgi:putative transposase
MSRRRIQLANGVYHVTTRGNRKQATFTDEADRVRFLQFVATVVDRLSWRCHAYCLMTNHYHLLVETPDANISEGMEYLNGRYARAFNARHGYEGHLFERRFYGELLAGNVHLLELSRYIVLNPVRGGLCRHAQEWRWSSYLAAIGEARRPAFLTTDWLLAQFHNDRKQARLLYADFVSRGHLRKAAARP